MAAQIGKIGCAMNTFFNKRIKGFTIIELMIVLVIVAILVALAYPSYIQYVRKSKRGEAQQLLLNWSINQEIYRSNNPTYAGPGDLPAPTNDHYTFGTVGDPTATAYVLQADAGGDQASDRAKDGSSCEVLSLDQNGVKLPAACWD
jgi:type IV pilus assembly protein PilE